MRSKEQRVSPDLLISCCLGSPAVAGNMLVVRTQSQLVGIRAS